MAKATSMEWRGRTDAILTSFLLTAAVLLPLGGAKGAAGDVLKVAVERANLRAQPSDKSETLAQVQRGDSLIELQRLNDWIGVRVERTGEEGWIFGNLAQLQSASRLGRETAPAGFKSLSPGFDGLIRNIDDRSGYHIVQRVEATDTRTLRVTPTREWLRYGDGQAHVLGALAFYGLWKTNQNQQPVTLLLLDDQGREYVGITDEASGPSLRVHSPAQD